MKLVFSKSIAAKVVSLQLIALGKCRVSNQDSKLSKCAAKFHETHWMLSMGLAEITEI